MKHALLLIAITLCGLGASAQVSVRYSPYRIWGNVAIGKQDDTNPDNCAVLDLGMPGIKKGLLLPQGNKDSISSPKQGLIYYNILDSSLYLRQPHGWSKVGAGGPGGTTDTSSLSNRIDQKVNWADTGSIIATIPDLYNRFRDSFKTAKLTLLNDKVIGFSPLHLVSIFPGGPDSFAYLRDGGSIWTDKLLPTTKIVSSIGVDEYNNMYWYDPDGNRHNMGFTVQPYIWLPWDNNPNQYYGGDGTFHDVDATYITNGQLQPGIIAGTQNDGYVVTLDGGIPTWKAPTSGGGSGGASVGYLDSNYVRRIGSDSVVINGRNNIKFPQPNSNSVLDGKVFGFQIGSSLPIIDSFYTYYGENPSGWNFYNTATGMSIGSGTKWGIQTPSLTLYDHEFGPQYGPLQFVNRNNGNGGSQLIFNSGGNVWTDATLPGDSIVSSIKKVGTAIKYHDAWGTWHTAWTDTHDASDIVSGLLSVARGGTGTATPGLVAGTNVTITGTWPNQTINSTGGGGGDTTGFGLETRSHAAATYEPVISAGSSTQYWRGDKTWQTLNKAAVGLSNVDNTSDASKPVSTATQTALDAKLNITDTAGKWVNSVYRKTGTDSVFYVKGATSTFAFKDSTGGGTSTTDRLTNGSYNGILGSDGSFTLPLVSSTGGATIYNAFAPDNNLLLTAYYGARLRGGSNMCSVAQSDITIGYSGGYGALFIYPGSGYSRHDMAFSVGTAAPDGSSALDVGKSMGPATFGSTIKGSRPAPLMSASERASITSPAVGLMAYQTDGTEGLYLKTSAGWSLISGGSGSGGSETDPVVAAISGMVKSNGSVISAATPGTDYLSPTGTETISNKTISGASNSLSNIPNSALTNNYIGIAGNNKTLGTSITLDQIMGLSTTGIVVRTAPNTLGIATPGSDYTTPSGTEPLTNKNIDGSANTLSNIGNSALVNSSITIAGTSTSLGGAISRDVITGVSTNGLLKRTSANTLATAVSGTDYAPATTGSALLAGNGTGGFNNVGIGSGLMIIGSTLTTNITETDPVVAGISGIVKSNGATISAAAAGTDYVTPNGTETITNKNFNSSTNTFPVLGLINVRTFTSGITYTPTSGTTRILVQLVGAGGGGGGSAGIASGSGAGAGGGAGAFVQKYITGISAATTYTIAIGTAGTAGAAASSGTGGTGGSTTFTTDASATPASTTITAAGGVGGAGQAGSTTASATSPALGGSGGSGTNGDVNGVGAAGAYGMHFLAALSVSGQGASTNYGQGGKSVIGTTSGSAGNAGTGYGAGGAGAASGGNTNVAGGAGAPGIMIIYEYK